MTFLADIERKLTSQAKITSCSVPGKPRSIDGQPYMSPSNVLALTDAGPLLLDVAVAALRCDITRVIGFNLIKSAYVDSGGTQRVSYHDSASIAGDWHQFAHEADGNAGKRFNFNAISKWLTNNVFKALLDRLDVDEGNGKTMLDNSLVVWGNELGLAHYSTDVQTLMAGGAGGAIKTGYYVDYIDWTQSYANPIEGWGVLSPGLPTNRWLVTILQAMGLSPADYERNGTPGYGNTKLIDAPYNWPTPNTSQIGAPLPGIFA
jgi:hypothetical protein